MHCLQVAAAWRCGERASFVSTGPLRRPHLQSQKCWWQGQGRWQHLGSLYSSFLVVFISMNKPLASSVRPDQDVTSAQELDALGEINSILFLKQFKIFIPSTEISPFSLPSGTQSAFPRDTDTIISSRKRDSQEKPSWSTAAVWMQCTQEGKLSVASKERRRTIKLCS